MSRNAVDQCDICRRPTERIVHKMFLANANRVHRHRSPHSDYTHHLDVGICCAEKIAKAFKWTARVSQEEYANRSRKHDAKTR